MAPDSIPDSMWAPENIVPFLGVPENRVLRNVVSVRFKSGTHQAERQAAIDLIGGEVIGGKPAPPGVLEGTYYVQIAGDSTGRAAVDAADRLEALPQVSNANFVLLTRPEDWLPWRLPDDSSDRNSGRVSGPSEPDTVPAVAPDTLPADLYRPENIRYGSACISGASLRGTVVLRFRQGTSQAQKQAAADLVGGVVIGGRRPTEKEGYYFIRVMDGENGEALCNAIDRLNELPQVGFASHEVFVSTFGREPDDQAP